MANHRSLDIRSQIRKISLLLATAFATAVLPGAATQAQTLTVLHNFTYGSDGGMPYAGVTLDQQGRIYGTTTGGGAQYGTVYRLVHQGGSWVLTPLYLFQGTPDGYLPYGGVTFGPDGALYGTTTYGGDENQGTVFRLRPPANACAAALCQWQETVIHNFGHVGDGDYPTYGNLTFDRAGNIYGTAVQGGAHNDGVVFKLTPSGGGWSESVLWNFTGGSDGAYPQAGVTFDSAGNLYGTTSYGQQGEGTVYELSPTQSGWTETTLYTFTPYDNGSGVGGLVFDRSGNLFGITGLQEGGVAYELTPLGQSWNYTRLQVFNGGYPSPLAGPTFDAQGNLYGPLPSGGQDDGGEIFRLTLSGGSWVYSVYYDFANGGGFDPIGAVTFDASGNMYGTSSEGGSQDHGTVWEITP